MAERTKSNEWVLMNVGQKRTNVEQNYDGQQQTVTNDDINIIETNDNNNERRLRQTTMAIDGDYDKR
jgi:hypothetical protein